MLSQEAKNVYNLFNSIKKISDIDKLIHDGESEGQYLECKNPRSPQEFDRKLRAEIAKEISGFSNTGGGIIIFGVDTDIKQELDVLTQIEPVAIIKQFAKKLEVNIPLLIEPAVKTEINIIKNKQSDTKGVVVLYIEKTSRDPIRNSIDKKFYLRVGDKTPEMPYETLKNMFSVSSSPDLFPIFDRRIVKLEPDKESWRIPIIIENRSSAVAKDVEISVIINNFSSCENVVGDGFEDSSNYNPGRKIFIRGYDKPVHRGMNRIVGNLIIKMKKIKRARRALNLTITIYATNMRARERSVVVQLAKKGFSVKSTKDKFLY